MSNGKTSPSSESDRQMEFEFEDIPDGVPAKVRVGAPPEGFTTFGVARTIHNGYWATKQRIMALSLLGDCKQAFARRRARGFKAGFPATAPIGHYH